VRNKVCSKMQVIFGTSRIGLCPQHRLGLALVVCLLEVVISIDMRVET
jgi:hypothetical protein